MNFKNYVSVLQYWTMSILTEPTFKMPLFGMKVSNLRLQLFLSIGLSHNFSTKIAKEFIFHVYIHSDPFYNYASDQCYVK